jgi:hypothetical protein
MSNDTEVTLKDFITQLHQILESFPNAVVPFASEFRIVLQQNLFDKTSKLPRLVYNYQAQQDRDAVVARNLSLQNQRNF